MKSRHESLLSRLAPKSRSLMRNEIEPPLVIYIDVDDTLVRTFGTKRMPIGGMADHVKALVADGAVLYCWSSGGAAYARLVANELGIGECFSGFLPKPHVMIDDQEINAWRRLIQVHPGQCGGFTVADYRCRLLG